jgi:bile acid-coenzyme A ligase
MLIPIADVPALVVGGEADWNAPNSVPADFVPKGMSDEPLNSPVARYWKAMTSGGSTGRPKVILDHQPAVADTSAEPILGIPHGVSLLNPCPLYHNAPFIASHLGLFAGGRVTGLVKFDAEETLRLIEANRVQWVNFVPTMMHRIWALPEKVRNAYDLSSLKVVFHMAAPMPPWLKEKWIEWLGPERIFELYGGTERQGATIISGVEWLAHRGSVGKIGEASALRIIGEDGNDVAPGESGEIYFLPTDGAGSTYHYLGAEPKRRAGGWESLGDIGRLDADGYLYLGDRLADMILRGGANVYPAEVEAAVTAHPKVRSCVVVGLPDPELGQRIHAILELGEAADAIAVVDGMGDFLADQLSRYKHPESFEIVSVGPRDDSGKVRRTLLRDERAAWLREGRAFRIMPPRGPGKRVE